MSLQSDNLPILLLENLPKPVTPPVKDRSTYVLEINSETQQVLDGCDWKAYEKNVITGLLETVKRYNKASHGEQVFQVSIITDPQRQKTEISLETKAHARQYIEWSAEWLRERGLSAEAEKLEIAGYNTNPAEFLHPAYYTILHRELRPLDGVDYSDDEARKAAEVWCEIALLEVVERVRSLYLLADLPLEAEAWIGISSPRTQYDHVTSMKGKQ